MENQTQTAEKLPVGRQRWVLSDDEIVELERLAGLHCTMAEAAAWFKISLDTLQRRFKEEPERYQVAWDRGQQNGKASLRRTQFALAEKNAAMAIFLGKNYLGQRDQIETVGTNVTVQVQTDIDMARQIALILRGAVIDGEAKEIAGAIEAAEPDADPQP